MADVIIFPAKPDAKCEADTARAHAMPLWLMKSDGSIVNAADALCCILDALGETKQISHIPGCDENGEPALLVVTTTCAADGTSTTETETIPMGQKFTPGTPPAQVPDKENLTEFQIVGPAAAQPLDTIIEDAIAASAVTAFSIEGSDIAPVDVKECGSVYIATKDGRPGIVINGDTENPVASWEWDGGISGLDTVEILDGCEVRTLVCAIKMYTPAKV